MKLVALMPARNEEWILGLSARVALRWCDDLVVLDHGSTDRTPEILDELSGEHPGRVHRLRRDDVEAWDEMDHRQATLEAGRAAGGTHFAIVDADEILTGNLLGSVRRVVEALAPAEILDVPMAACWRSKDAFRDDGSVWSRAQITLAFRDAPTLHWKATGGYHHHSRAPHGSNFGARRRLGTHGVSCIMHMQFANWRRLVAKHAWYKMMETVRYPGRRTPQQVDDVYNLALSESGLSLSPCPEGWWKPYEGLLDRLDMTGEPWQAEECRRLWQVHGAKTFEGLTLWGVPEGRG